MTDKELDRARALEAERQWCSAVERPLNTRCNDVALIAARLAREGWTPEDPLLKEAYKLSCDWWPMQATTRQITHADSERLALAALKRGIELGKAKALVRDAETVSRMRDEALRPGGLTFGKW